MSEFPASGFCLNGRRAVFLAGLALLSGCSGTVQMTPITPEQIASNYSKGIAVDGVIVVRPATLVQVDMLTQTTVKKSGSSTQSDDCRRVPARHFVTVADWQHPYVLKYNHGILEAYTFGVTLTPDGVLIGINTSSTPDQAKTLVNTTTALSSIAGLARSAQIKDGLPECTITPVFVGYEQPPYGQNAIPEYGKTVILP